MTKKLFGVGFSNFFHYLCVDIEYGYNLSARDKRLS
jgi:hypothetical protein